MDGLLDRFDSTLLAGFRRSLRAWYAKHARDLPWRNTADPYRVWISEIMLQQTTVTAVIPYFERFLKAFPTVEKLAAADEREVLALWEGLGYYSRARNIHRTAKIVADKFGGRFPDDIDALRELPGIGRYTAGAIVSFAFDKRAPIVEANTLRLYCRLLGYEGDPKSAVGQRLLWEFAERIVPARSPGRFNQAVMELGATLCTPSAPNCESCPVRTECGAAARGLQGTIPAAARRPEITDVTEAAVCIERRGAFLLRRRPEGERWAGLWDFPRFALEAGSQFGPPHPGPLPQGGEGTRKKRGNGASDNPRLARHLESQVAALTGIEVRMGGVFTELKHSVTRFRIRLLCYRAEYAAGKLAPRSEIVWAKPGALGEYPLSVTGRKIARLLAE